MNKNNFILLNIEAFFIVNAILTILAFAPVAFPTGQLILKLIAISVCLYFTYRSYLKKSYWHTYIYSVIALIITVYLIFSRF